MPRISSDKLIFKTSVIHKGFIHTHTRTHTHTHTHMHIHTHTHRLPWWFKGKESAAMQETPGLIPRSGRSPGEGNGYPLQYSCLENSMDRRAWWAIVHGVTKSWTQTESLSLSLFSYTYIGLPVNEAKNSW